MVTKENESFLEQLDDVDIELLEAREGYIKAQLRYMEAKRTLKQCEAQLMLDVIGEGAPNTESRTALHELKKLHSDDHKKLLDLSDIKWGTSKMLEVEVQTLVEKREKVLLMIDLNVR
jgi:hypothetical protein